MTTIYDVLLRPILTEKSSHQFGKLHQFAFEVAQDATKNMIKDALETLFDVRVIRVNIINVPAKQSRRAQSRRVLVRRSAYKKAIVTLHPDDTIEAFEGVR
ncbi:MAG: 50S ribosomal protein L23 [Anaerolineales bacterium]|nr:50S ribosomal protein L23 [Anaerolineales bacterium]HEY61554.1 50S ribosomal protein L23 [Anaerolineae bacterium]